MKYRHNKNLPNCIVCDIDGTLTEMKGRGPFEWDKVGQDEVNEPVADLIRTYSDLDISIIIATGRDGVCEDLCYKWLNENEIPYSLMYIRPEGNNEQDSVIKKRILEKIRKNYNILFWLDDRDQVVEMLREEGVPTFQVNYGDF